MVDTPEEQKARGTLAQAEGRVKKAVGELLDDPELKREGAIKDVEGQATEKIGEMRRRLPP